MAMNKTQWWLGPLLLGSGLALAGGGVHLYQPGEVPQASEVADILSGGVKRPKMRGISLDPGYQSDSNVQSALDEVAKPSSSAIGLPVEFGFNSAEILPENRPQLDAVAEGIKLTNGVKVVVEGHTDAHGSESYNQQLSRLRAQAVKRYLTEAHGIRDAQLVIRGMGESAPIDQANPFAAANRRVQFRAAN